MKKSFKALAITAALAISGLSQAANAASWGSIQLVNNSPYYMDYTILSDGWNCNDAPLRGESLGAGPNNHVDLKILRKDGHGCNGEQGIFLIKMTIPTYEATPLPISYSSDGCLVDPHRRASQLGYSMNYNVIMEGDCPTYRLIITPAIQ